MKHILITINVAILLLFMNNAHSETFVYPAENPVFAITFPDTWKIDIDEDLLHASPKDESIYFGLWALEDIDSLDAALEIIDDLAADLLDDLTLGEVEEIEINKILFLTVDGEGKSEQGDQVNVSIALFSPDDETIFIVIYFGTPEAEEEYEEELITIVQSIQKK